MVFAMPCWYWNFKLLKGINDNGLFSLQGCDASVLIASTPGNSAERDAVPNFTLRGFDIVDDIKKQVEAICPGIVSCADIIALASRDAVVQVRYLNG